MSTEGSAGHGPARGAALRTQQDRALTTSFALAEMEHALASEAFHVGVALRRSGLELDPSTFVALRILDASVGEVADPWAVLEVMRTNGTLERSIRLAADLLGRDAA